MRKSDRGRASGGTPGASGTALRISYAPRDRSSTRKLLRDKQVNDLVILSADRGTACEDAPVTPRGGRAQGQQPRDDTSNSIMIARNKAVSLQTPKKSAMSVLPTFSFQREAAAAAAAPTSPRPFNIVVEKPEPRHISRPQSAAIARRHSKRPERKPIAAAQRQPAQTRADSATARRRSIGQQQQVSVGRNMERKMKEKEKEKEKKEEEEEEGKGKPGIVAATGQGKQMKKKKKQKKRLQRPASAAALLARIPSRLDPISNSKKKNRTHTPDDSAWNAVMTDAFQSSSVAQAKPVFVPHPQPTLLAAGESDDEDGAINTSPRVRRQKQPPVNGEMKQDWTEMLLSMSAGQLPSGSTALEPKVLRTSFVGPGETPLHKPKTSVFYYAPPHVAQSVRAQPADRHAMSFSANAVGSAPPPQPVAEITDLALARQQARAKLEAVAKQLDHNRENKREQLHETPAAPAVKMPRPATASSAQRHTQSQPLAPRKKPLNRAQSAQPLRRASTHTHSAPILQRSSAVSCAPATQRRQPSLRQWTEYDFMRDLQKHRHTSPSKSASRALRQHHTPIKAVPFQLALTSLLGDRQYSGQSVSRDLAPPKHKLRRARSNTLLPYSNYRPS